MLDAITSEEYWFCRATTILTKCQPYGAHIHVIPSPPLTPPVASIVSGCTSPINARLSSDLVTEKAMIHE